MKTELQKNWAAAVNDTDNKPYKDKTYGNKIKGKINGMHYVIYNVVRGYPIERSFNKGSDFLTNSISRVSSVLKLPQFYSSRKELLFAFGETITVEEFTEKWNEAIRLYSGS